MRALSAVLVAALSFGCASVPSERPKAGCWFDDLRRFTYVLVLERDSVVTRWVIRQALSLAPDPVDREQRITSSISVRPGWCPDESAHFFGRPDPWRQTEPSKGDSP